MAHKRNLVQAAGYLRTSSEAPAARDRAFRQAWRFRPGCLVQIQPCPVPIRSRRARASAPCQSCRGQRRSCCPAVSPSMRSVGWSRNIGCSRTKGPRPASVKAASHMPRRGRIPSPWSSSLEAEGLSYRKIAAELAARGHVICGRNAALFSWELSAMQATLRLDYPLCRQCG
jgi:hypothetical protein